MRTSFRKSFARDLKEVKDPAVLATLKAGDKVRFRAEKSGGALVVTDIQPVK